MDGLADAAQPVAFWLGEPEQAGGEGDGLELLMDKEPFGQMGREARVGGGYVPVVGIGPEVEVVEQG
ncbi:hypothetical protein [Streptomyces scabiei]|uniref:hypothetical protein n=1 Tax=Streptomyces scabiei TaxID=1930 RepID=UPI0029AE2267|nr:hypothetical protein [Streptomyces scabiei]MDX3523279.1 hypothetical protein [Streptomyces scabiei]